MDRTSRRGQRQGGTSGRGPARYDLPDREGPRADLDLASRGVVKVLEGGAASRDRRYPEMPWEPKAAFDAVAEWYGRH
ncbi:MAG TPA: hypothetical protein VF159_00190 [Gemmatimonadaceae bacterium]